MKRESDIWHWGCRGKRWQFRITVYKHYYFDNDHRWVFQPCFIWDKR